MSFRIKTLAAAVLAAALAAGCGGGGAGGTVSGLTVPENMSVVAAKPDAGSGKPVTFGHALAGLAKAFDAADTDYSTDAVETHVFDPSMEPLDLVNEILCSMGQTRAKDMVNQGPYIALIDTDQCSQGDARNDGSTGQSSGTGGTTYEKWVIDSTRADNASPQVVKLWIREEDGPGGMPQIIKVETTVREGVSDTRPFGDFTLNFRFEDPDTSAVNGGGTLETVTAPSGKVAYTFFMNEGAEQVSYAPGEHFYGMRATVEMTPDGTAGVARTGLKGEGNEGGFDWTEGGAFSVAFDAGHLMRSEAASLTDLDTDTFAADTCLSRDTFNTNVWRYDLYHHDDTTFNGQAVLGGDRVTLNSGFPFVYDNGGSDVFGHIGYWGLWVEDPTVTIPNGATITRRDRATGGTTDYTLVRAPGKLIRRTARQLALTGLVGETLDFWGEADPDGAGAQVPRFGQWRVRYLRSGDAIPAGSGGGTAPADGFYALAEVTGWDEMGPIQAPIPAQDVTPPANAFLGLWSDSLGGQVNFVGGATTVTFYEEAFVGGEDPVFANGALTLNCFERCLKAPVAQTDVDAGWDGVYVANATDVSTGVTAYTIDPADMTLRLGAQAVTLDTGVDPTGTDHEWGMNTGEMVTDAVKAGMTNIWDLYDPAVVGVSYRWETGANDWNRYTAALDGNGDYVAFDRPIQFAYVHTTAGDANGDATYDGKTFRLNYGGSGDLWGIPWTVDPGTGRWYAAFTLKDGTVMGPTGTEFVVKAREREQTMAEDPGQCGALDTSQASAPQADLPTAVDGTPDVGVMPTVTDAPAVIGGELQT